MVTKLDAFLHESYKDGDIVEAVFTNSGHVRYVVGEVAGKTKNYWKIKATIRSPYSEEPLGRVFRIETPMSRRYSANNRIIGLHANQEAI